MQNIRKLSIEIDAINLVKSKIDNVGGIGSELLIHVNQDENADKLIETINAIENVSFAIITG